jgi:hypothetical protein
MEFLMNMADYTLKDQIINAVVRDEWSIATRRSIARQLIGKHIPATTNKQATIG